MDPIQNKEFSSGHVTENSESTLLGTNGLPLKINASKTIISSWGPPSFQALWLLAGVMISLTQTMHYYEGNQLAVQHATATCYHELSRWLAPLRQNLKLGV